MSLATLETEDFKTLMQEHLLKSIEYMFNNNQEFGIACEIQLVHFEPDLPKELKKSLPEITLFMLANYSFESATVDRQYISFEAGFGTENFGSLVQIPLLAIKQLFVEEYPILINVAPSTEITEEIKEKEIDSMSALLNNPENARLLKKKKS